MTFSLHSAPRRSLQAIPWTANACAFLLALVCASPLSAQIKLQSYNDEGVTAPCITLGVGVLIEKKCVDTMAKAGFVREPDLGHSGLTVGTTGEQDGVVTAVAAGSPAERAGIKPGALLVSVDGKPARRSPGSIVEQQIFGEKDHTVRLKLRHGGAERDVEIKRAPYKPPSVPKSPGMLISLRALMDWRGNWVPCIGMGPGALAVFAYCDSHYGSLGYIRESELGTTGLKLNLERTDAAQVSAVQADSPAAAAGVQPGAEVVSVDGKPLTASTGASANVMLFGRAGTKHAVTLRDSQGDSTVELVLAPPAEKTEQAP